MKTRFLIISIMAAFALSFSAQAQRFGNDILLHECPTSTWIRPKISVADNGWIYVLMSKTQNSAGNDETRIFRSKDGGLNFQEIWREVNADNTYQGGRDFVVTGNSESNINIWVVCADNNSVYGHSDVKLLKMNANGGNVTTAYSYSLASTVHSGVAISTNYRSPDDTWLPFTIAFAASSNYDGSTGYIDYSYSTDGGANFNGTVAYSKSGSEFGAIDLSIGQANQYSYYPRMGIVFEMDKESEMNIGFLAAYADAYDLTDVLQVNKKYSATDYAAQPKIQWLCNNTLDEPYNFVIVYSNLYGDEDWDVMQVTPTSGYSLSNHTLDNLQAAFTVAYWVSDEDSPDLAYDKVYNNYLLVSRQTTSDGESILQYRTVSYSNVSSADWQFIGDVSSSSTYDLWYYSPVVDIDPTRTQACFAHELYGNGSTRLMFDSEWSTVDVEEIALADNKLKLFPNPATDVININLGSSENYTVKLIDFQGRVVKEAQFTSDQATISIEGLPAGIYVVKINSDNKQFTEKIIKSK